MPAHSNSYTFSFAVIVCFFCSFFLAVVSRALLERQCLNVEVDMKKNILKSVNLQPPLSSGLSVKKILDIYDSAILEIVIDKDGRVVEGKKPKDVQFEKHPEWMPLYIYRDSKEIKGYSYPVSGKGLWSTLYGYFAVQPDAKTVRGISFYKHGETPGLGGEIEKPWFQNNFRGKSIWSEQKQQICSVGVVKGKVTDMHSVPESDHYVDGISGATITSRGVTKLLAEGVRRYEPYFKNIRKNFKK